MGKSVPSDRITFPPPRNVIIQDSKDPFSSIYKRKIRCAIIKIKVNQV